MNYTIFRSPTGKVIENPDLKVLEGIILRPPQSYWHQGAGGASLEFIGYGIKTKLMILPNVYNNIYLKYIDESGEIWLSLENFNKLDELIECSDEWFASEGLFLHKDKAWLAVHEFLHTGGKTRQIDWIKPDDLPDGGNW